MTEKQKFEILTNLNIFILSSSVANCVDRATLECLLALGSDLQVCFVRIKINVKGSRDLAVLLALRCVYQQSFLTTFLKLEMRLCKRVVYNELEGIIGTWSSISYLTMRMC